MNGIQFVIDNKGRKTAMLIDLRKQGAAAQDFQDGLIVESRRNEKDIPFEEVIKHRPDDHTRQPHRSPKRGLRVASMIARRCTGGQAH